MKVSVVIPAHNEHGSIAETVENLIRTLREAGLAHEIIIVDDGSTDGTAQEVRRLAGVHPQVICAGNTGRHGYGMAVRAGLPHVTGEAVIVMMADGSDSAPDAVSYCRKLEEGYDCVFGSRFMRGSAIIDYPFHKLLLNRMANWFIRIIFGLRYNDITNAFKCYRREVVEAMYPLISPHFNLTVEMPLKAIVRGFSFATVPITWRNRKTGISKLRIREMGSRYLFIVLYLWLEKHLSRGDYHRASATPSESKLSTRRA